MGVGDVTGKVMGKSSVQNARLSAHCIGKWHSVGMFFYIFLFLHLPSWSTSVKTKAGTVGPRSELFLTTSKVLLGNRLNIRQYFL